MRKLVAILTLCLALTVAFLAGRSWWDRRTGDQQQVHRRAQAILDDMTLDQKIGTLFMTRPEALGFNVDFAPIADIWSNPENRVIGDRAFSSTADGAAPFVSQAVLGLEEAGMASCVKHFPGHGDTTTDSHTGSAVSYVDGKTLRQRELIPFISGIEAGSPMVMVGHIKLPGVTADGLPASLSSEIVTRILRGELDFDGVVVTDALEMGAVTGFYTPQEAAVVAVQAGCDILLMPASLPEAFAGVQAAVASGKVSEDRIDESVLRIIKMRIRYGGEKDS